MATEFNKEADKEATYVANDSPHHSGEVPNRGDVQRGFITDNADELHRRLSNRQIQLLAIGGSIGTALFVSIGNGLAAGGPGSLFIAYASYSLVVACVNNCVSEMIILHPVSGGFIRLATKWYDEALGFMVGWNFFLYEALLIPFEITAIGLVLSFWRDDIPAWSICIACIILYAAINVLAVRAFGEAEFWLSGGKVILIFMLFFFTFITMVGGNPQKDAYGFRYWKNPGAFAENSAKTSTGSLARFEGFLSCLWSASFTVVGPEYIAMAAAETKRPRRYIKTAFKTVYWRFGMFFILGALCVGIVVPWNDPQLQAVFLGTTSGGSAAASPYVIAMTNMGIGVLPHIVNALLVTSIFSAGNTYTYVATRSLYSLALEGHAPKFLRKCTSNGVPMYCFCVVMAFPFLSFLQVSDSSAVVISWLVSLITAGALINYFVIALTFINFHKACKVQGVDRRTHPYYGWFQPYCAYIAATVMVIICIFYGYGAIQNWSVEAFFQNYTMQLLAPILYFGWKIIKRTKKVKPEEVDLVWQRPIVDAYEESFLSPPTGFWLEMGQMLGIKRHIRDDERRGSIQRRGSAINPFKG